MLLVFRHIRWRLLVWAVVITGMIPLANESQRATFPTPGDREAYAAIANTPLVAALTGTPYAADTFGGILVLKIWMTLALTLVLSTVFLVTRNGRSEEEAGRTELLRANVLGRHAYTLAGWLVIAAYNLSVGALAVGIAYVLRAIGDLQGNGTTPGWTSPLSPSGWAQQMRAFGENQWWPLAPLVLGAVLLRGIAMAVEA
ncbi:hypothetical protein GCM10009628_41040 [Paeniglutamicibacter kerguelensis]